MPCRTPRTRLQLKPAVAGRNVDPRTLGQGTTAVVVHYGPDGPTRMLANSLIRECSSLVGEVVVVANDGLARPADLDPQVQWLVPERNLGYGDAFNFAIAGRIAAVYVLLNTDIVMPRATFDLCVSMFDDPSVGVVGPVLRRGDGSLQSGAATLSRWLRRPQVLIDPGPVSVDCTWVTGAAMFLSADVANDVGMDGSYFLGDEDADLCVRARRAGWRVVCCGRYPAQHAGSLVIRGPRWTYYATRNRVWFTRANFGLHVAIVNWLGALLVLPRIAMADILVRRDMTSSRLAILGLRHAFRPKPDRLDGSLAEEPLAGMIMQW